MKVALIPPTSLLHQIVDQPLHMVIPEGLKGPVYRNFYKVLGMRDGVAIMLDNGAFEAEGSKPLSHETLIQMVYEVDADILVLPDHMGELDKTIQTSRDFMHIWEMHHAVAETGKPIQFMGVVQGADESQLRRCVKKYLELEEEFEQTIILGLPKWLSEEIDTHIRLKTALYIEEHAPHPIHLLGLSYAWPKEIIQASNYPNINSVDTSAPFVYAAYDIHIATNVRGPRRPDNYFSLDARSLNTELVQQNTETLWRWASGQA